MVCPGTVVGFGRNAQEERKKDGCQGGSVYRFVVDWEKMMGCAEAKLAEAKQGGRNRVIVG